MSKHACFLMIILFSINVFATENIYSIGIVDIEPINKEYSAVYASDGRIYDVSNTNQKLINNLHFALVNHLEVKVDFGRYTKLIEKIDGEEREEIFEIELSSTETERSLLKNKSFYKSLNLEKEKIEAASLQNTYVTDIKKLGDLEEIFERQRRQFRSRSQCYNRAHVWSWELNKVYYDGKRIQPGKMWIFYSRNYIRKHDFKWWFHVAPYLTVNNEIKIIDRTFLKKPTSENDWVNHLSRVNISCSEVKNYSSYREEYIPADCYFIKTSQFYWQPWQINAAEKENQERGEWNVYELKRAYRNGVGWFADVP